MAWMDGIDDAMGWDGMGLMDRWDADGMDCMYGMNGLVDGWMDGMDEVLINGRMERDEVSG